MKSLIIEDDGTSRLFIEKTLQAYGPYKSAKNGLEGLELLMESIDSKAYYDLICLDIMLPKVDGLKVLESYREAEKKSDHHAIVIMTTALNDEATVSRAFEHDCDAYLWKPFSLDALQAVLKEHRLI